MPNRRGAHMAAYHDRITQRDKRVRRVHIAAGQYTLCNRPRSEGDIGVTLGTSIGDRAPPNNTCAICRKIYLR